MPREDLEEEKELLTNLLGRLKNEKRNNKTSKENKTPY